MLGHRSSHRLVRIDSEQRGDRVVEVTNLPLGIDHHDAFLERVEDRLEKSLLVVEPLQIRLEIALPHAVDPVEQLVQEGVFHENEGQI